MVNDEVLLADVACAEWISEMTICTVDAGFARPTELSNLFFNVSSDWYSRVRDVWMSDNLYTKMVGYSAFDFVVFCWSTSGRDNSFQARSIALQRSSGSNRFFIEQSKLSMGNHCRLRCSRWYRKVYPRSIIENAPCWCSFGSSFVAHIFQRK